jgi:hypothetical protein
LAVGLLVQPAEAQVLYGSLVGTVTDQTEAVVPRAAIAITNKATGGTRETTTDDAGRYSLVNVLAGSYELKVTATGFRPLTRTDVAVTINVVTRVDVKLEVGAVAESVTVSGTLAMLTTDKADVHAELSSQMMARVPPPNIYRNYQSLIDLVPGATPADFQNAVVDTPARALTTRINGTARNNNNTLVDGAVNIYIWLPHHTVYVQPMESIETVNVTTNSFDAEQGMAGGAAITVATKSGTNEVHGVGFWYHNNQHFNSKPYYYAVGQNLPKSILNQGGGTVGGPIKKNKLFYFGSLERTMERSGVSGNYATPPADFRNGDFSNWTYLSIIYDPASATDPKLRKPFPNNTVPKDRISPIFDNIQKAIPPTNQKSLTDPNNLQGTYFASGTMMMNRNMWDGKINYNATSRLVIWGKYSRMDANVYGVPVFGPDLMGPVMGTAGVGKTHVQIPTVGFTHTFSPTFLMDGVFGYTRMDLACRGQDDGKNIGLDVWKIPGTNGGTQFAKDVNYSGAPQICFGFTCIGNGDTWVPVTRNDRSVTYTTNVSKLRGAHEIRFGFDLRHHAMNHWQPETANPRGYIDFATGSTVMPGVTGAAGGGGTPGNYAAALLGLVNSYSKSLQNILMTPREWQFALYVRDRWQVSRKFTVDAGLRYEYYPLTTREGRGIERWNPYTNIVTLGGIGSIPKNNGMYTSKKMFGPRLGLAYRIKEDWVVRTGYGITFDPLPFSRPLRGLYPATLTGGWNAGSAEAAMRDTSYGWYNTLAQGIPPVPVPDISTGSITLPVAMDMGPLSPWGGMIHRGYIQSWNFTIERKLPFDSVGQVGYVATRTIHQMLYRNINTDGPGEDVNAANRALAKLYGRTVTSNMWDGIGYGTYNGLQATLNKSFSKGFMTKASYSFGRYMNMGEDDGWDGLNMWQWEPMIKRNYAPANVDRRHMFTMAWVYELPFGGGKKYNLSGIADKVLGGWNINGYFAKYSGIPFNVTGSSTSLRCNGCSQTADLIKPVVKLGGHGLGDPYYDPASFMDPLVYFNATGGTNYRSGTMGRNVLYGPGYWRLNPAVYKTFKMTERVSIQFRAESINATNTPRWGNPSGGAGGPTRDAAGNILRLNNFMCITGATTDRRFQFGLRLTY